VITWLRRLLLGRGQYASPALQWLTTPMLRIAIVLVVLSLVVGGGFIPLWVLAGLAFVVYIVATVVNAVLLRRERSRS
jgi:hypothetical protein